MTPRTLCQIIAHPARAARIAAAAAPGGNRQADDLIRRIRAHAARIGRTGPAPLICPGART